MKSNYLFLVAALAFLPATTFAQGIQGYIGSIITFINTVLIPFLIGVAFLFFAFNAIRFFVLEGANEDGREKAKALTLYSIIAIVLIVSFWGIMSVLANGTGLSGQGAPTPDYMERGGSAPEGNTWQPTGGASV